MYSPWFLFLGKLGRNPVDHFREPETMSLELPAMDAATPGGSWAGKTKRTGGGLFFFHAAKWWCFLGTVCNSLYLLKSFCGVRPGLTGVAQAHPHPMAHLEVIETSITRWVMLFGCIICYGLKGRGKGCRQHPWFPVASCTKKQSGFSTQLAETPWNTHRDPSKNLVETTDDTAEISKGGSPDSLEGFVEALCCQWVWYFFSTSSTVSWLLQGHLEDLNISE